MDIVSNIPGRLRIRLNNLYRNMDLAPKLNKRLYSINEVNFVRISPLTAKILIIYDSNISKDKLLSKIKSCINSKYEDSQSYLTKEQSSIIKDDINHRLHYADHCKSKCGSTLKNEYASHHLKYALFTFIGLLLTLLSGEYSLLIDFLLLVFIYQAISTIIDGLVKHHISTKLKAHQEKEVVIHNTNIQDSAMNFYNSLIPIVMIFAIFYSLTSSNYTLLLSLIFLMLFNAFNKSTSLVLSLVSKKFLTKGASLINVDRIDKICTMDTIIIDKTVDESDLEIPFIEGLREGGIINIHVFTNSHSIENQSKNLELKICKILSNKVKKADYIRSLKKENAIVALVTKDFIDTKVLEEVDVKIYVTVNPELIDSKFWDLTIPDYNFASLSETLDYCKFAMEKIYQNQLISLWLNITGIVLAFNQKLNLIYAWLISMVNRILIYLNSLRFLNYETIYV